MATSFAMRTASKRLRVCLAAFATWCTMLIGSTMTRSPSSPKCCAERRRGQLEQGAHVGMVRVPSSMSWAQPTPKEATSSGEEEQEATGHLLVQFIRCSRDRRGGDRGGEHQEQDEDDSIRAC